MMLPVYSLSNASEVVDAMKAETVERRLAKHNTPSNPMIIDEWLHDLSFVREKVRCLQDVSRWNDFLNVTDFINPEGENTYVDLRFVPAQFPEVKPTEQWIGLEYDPLYAPQGDKLSLVVHFDSLGTLEGNHCGLVLDEWSEIIPNRDQTTAVAFHYDQPNSEPPQAILLAVAPRLTAQTWNLEDLLDVVNETLDMAKKRAVEPDNLARTSLSTVLPAIVAPTAPIQTTITLPFRRVNDSSPYREEVLNP